MPRKRKYRMKGRGNELQSIATANKNLQLIDTLMKPKPPLQSPGQIVQLPIVKQGFGHKLRKRQRGGAAYVDKYGQFLHAY